MSLVEIGEIERLSTAAFEAKRDWEQAVLQLTDLKESSSNDNGELQEATERVEYLRSRLEKESLELIDKLQKLIGAKYTPEVIGPVEEFRLEDNSSRVIPGGNSNDDESEQPARGLIVPFKITLSSLVEGETIKVAIYQRPVHNPSSAIIAWQVLSLNYGEVLVVDVPAEFKLQARYPSKNPERYDGYPVLDQSFVSEVFSESASAFRINIGEGELVERTPVFIRGVADLVEDDFRVINDFDRGVEVAVFRGEDEIFEPQVIWPGGLLYEKLNGDLHVAVISQYTSKGQRLVREEISVTEKTLRDGDILTVTGSKWRGYSLGNS
ncbi:MAG TPA: hypothetical protein DIT18_02960 [Pseudomonas sp.]|nr:hypothetical protein [Pseudomonas sp.]